MKSYSNTIYLTLVFIALAIPAIGLGQVKHSFYAGISTEQIRERNISSSIFSGIGPHIEYTYSQQGNWNKEIGVQGLLIRPKSKLENKENALFTNVNLYVNFVKALDLNRHYFLGISFRTDYQGAYYNNFDQSHFYWASFLGSGIKFKYSRAVAERFFIKSNFGMPLIGFVSRPETIRETKADSKSPGYLLSAVHSGLQLSLPNRYFKPAVQIALAYSSSNKHSAEVFYTYESLRAKTSYSRELEEMTHSVGFKYTFQ